MHWLASQGLSTFCLSDSPARSGMRGTSVRTASSGTRRRGIFRDELRQRPRERDVTMVDVSWGGQLCPRLMDELADPRGNDRCADSFDGAHYRLRSSPLMCIWHIAVGRLEELHGWLPRRPCARRPLGQPPRPRRYGRELLVRRRRACSMRWEATKSNGSRLCSPRLSTTAPSLAAINVAAKRAASPFEAPPATKSLASRPRQARNIAAACSCSSGESAATVTATTAQPDLNCERTRIPRQMHKKRSVTSSGRAPSLGEKNLAICASVPSPNRARL